MQNDAFSEAFRRELLTFLRRRMPADDAEDVLQEVLLRAHNHQDELRDEQRTTGWLYQIARNATIDYYRRKAADRSDASPALDALPQEPDAPAGQELVRCMQHMLDRLPDEYREAVRQSDLENRPQQEIADKLGISLSGAKSRVQRGRLKLKSLMQECCHLELDKYGQAVEQVCRNEDCRCCHA